MPRPSRTLGRIVHSATINGGSTGPLVDHARGKCDACGATLVVDPLPHVCLIRPRIPASEYGRRRPIVASRVKPRVPFWDRDRS